MGKLVLLVQYEVIKLCSRICSSKYAQVNVAILLARQPTGVNAWSLDSHLCSDKENSGVCES